MSSPDETSTLTIKLGGDFHAPWAVFYGNPSTQRRQMIESFGIEDDPALSNIELLAKLSVDAQAIYTLARSGAKQETAPPARRSTRTAKAAEPAKEAEPEAPSDSVLQAINDAADAAELKAVWAENSDGFAANKVWQQAYREKTQQFKNNK